MYSMVLMSTRTPLSGLFFFLADSSRLFTPFVSPGTGPDSFRMLRRSGLGFLNVFPGRKPLAGHPSLRASGRILLYYAYFRNVRFGNLDRGLWYVRRLYHLYVVRSACRIPPILAL